MLSWAFRDSSNSKISESDKKKKIVLFQGNVDQITTIQMVKGEETFIAIILIGTGRDYELRSF